jgi:transposase-like protein
MPSREAPIDPLGEIETLTRQLASLEAQLSGKKISREQFEKSSVELKERISNAESVAYGMARTDESIAKKLRGRAYSQIAAQQVCNHFIYGSKAALEPEFGADHVPRYSIGLEDGAKLPVDMALLDRLADVNVLNAALFEKLLFCPKCGTPTNVYARFKCTQCGSIDISINRMIEHLACGTIHQERAFRVGKSMVCPTCNKALQKPDEQRLIGLVCACNKCGAHFEDPSQSFFCRKCEVDFNLTTGIVTEVYTYNINEKIIGEIRAHIGIPVIAKLLQGNGFEVTIPGIIAGEAKNAEFSILARRGPKAVAIDVALNDVEVEVEPVLGLYIKLLEAKPDIAVLGALPKLSARAREVASKHGISVAEGSTPDDVARRILEIAEADLPSPTMRT